MENRISDSLDSGDEVGRLNFNSPYRTHDDFEKDALIAGTTYTSNRYGTGTKWCSSLSSKTWALLFLSSFVLNVLLIGYLAITATQARSRLPPWPTDVYSPADEAVSYETKVFDDDFEHPTIYTRTDEEADAAWKTLYDGLLYLTIPTTQASHLPNKTSPHPRAPHLSLIGLDVFHQLHCLDNIRKSLYPSVYNSTGEERWAMHIGHCVDSIRQSLICSADISTIFFEWSEQKKFTLPSAEVTHTCRDWGRVREWAVEHRLMVDFDPRERAEGAPIARHFG